ncbi:MAG: hypothetical protein JXB03_12770 [Spirochaetales bacterium]|nr:hypothetical protein [Spirochaetales bacterium]
MKRVVSLVLAVLFIAASFSGCDVAEANKYEPTQAEVEEAVAAVTLSAAFGMLGALAGAEGVSINLFTEDITFSNFDISDYSDSYTTMSGTMSTNDAADTTYDMSLSGGPIETIKFTEPDTATSFPVEANGYNYTVGS